MEERRTAELVHLFNKHKPFSSYHAVLIGVMSYIAMLSGALMAYPIFGQYVSASYCNLSSLDMPVSAGFDDIQQSIMDNSTAYSLNCLLKEEFRSLNNNSVKCETFIFAQEPMAETIVSKYSLGCEKTVQNTLMTSLIFVGYCVGSAVGGAVSDRYGRILAIKLFCSCFVVISGLLCFVDNLVIYAFMRVVQVAFIIGSFGNMITYVFEICGPSYRSKITVVITGLPWSLGYAYVALIAQVTRDWWWTLIVLISVTIPFPILVHFIVPESFLFLASKGMYSRAKKVIQKFPKKTETEEEIEQSQRLESPVESKANIDFVSPDFLNSVVSFASIKITGKNSALTDLFGNKYMLCSFVLLVLIWICVSVLFNGLLYYMGRLPGSVFSNIYWTCLMDSVSYFSAYFLVPRLNRRTFMFSMFSLAATGCYTGSFLSTFPKYRYLIRWFALVSKLGVCGLYSAVFLVAAELFPTPVRSTATAIGMAFCTIGGFISPLIVDLDSVAVWLPYFIFGSFAVFGAGLGMLIPETKGMELMNTLHEGYIFHESAFQKINIFRKN